MRWELFDKAVNAARMVAQDEDIARDAAINALEECGDAPDGHILRRARDRAKDLVRSERRHPQVIHADMDTLPGASSTERDALANIERERRDDAVGQAAARILNAVEAGCTNAEIAVQYGVSEETVRLRRAAAELAADIHATKGH